MTQMMQAMQGASHAGRISLNQFAGLVTAPGLLQRNPSSCTESVNWEFPAPGVIRKRRGFAKQPGNAGGPVWKILNSKLMGTSVIAHVGTTGAGTNIRYGDGAIALTNIPTINGGALTRTPDSAVTPGVRMQMAVCQRNHYLTADEGVARVESDFQSGSSARFAGMPRGLPANGFSLVYTAATAFADGKARAYRVTWHRKDADGIELGGAPTSRCVWANAPQMTGWTVGVVADAAMAWLIPCEFGTKATALTTAYYWRLWGTRQYTEASELGDDEMHLISERYLTAGEIAAGIVTYTDKTPDTYLLSAPTLHTNLYNFPSPSEVGIRQGVVNEDAPPPAANTVAYWRDVLWYADCSSRPSITVGLLTALAANDTVSVTANGVVTTVTAKVAPAATNEFKLCTTGLTSAINLRDTVRDMCRALNVAGGLTVGFSAHPITTNSTQPGLVYIELGNLATATTQPISFSSSVLTKWQGFDGYAIGVNVLSVQQTNLIRFSKQLRGDSVPPINVISVGNADTRVMRIFPFRDRLIVFTDGGFYQVTGSTFADFSVAPFDLGYRLMGPEMVALCDEKVYAWCFEGVVEIDDGGVRVISAPIEPTIEAAIVACGATVAGSGTKLYLGRAAFAILGFATAYRNQHQVRFHYPEAYGAGLVGHCPFWLAFDTRTRTWTRGDFGQKSISGNLDGRSCSAVRFIDDLLVGGSWSTGADTYLFLERRAYAAADFSDDDRTGGNAAIRSILTFQSQIPDEEGAQHWQQTSINWDAREVSWRTLPASIAVAHATESASVAAQTVTVGEISTRIEPPDGVRRGQRLQVTITHEAIEYAGIVGVMQAYRPGTRFTREVAP